MTTNSTPFSAIEADDPESWQDLQRQAARILRECGVDAEVEKDIETARGSVSVDVWAYDGGGTPPQTYLLECKHWRRAVPKSVVHAFRAIVGDSGANWGAIVSTSPFQRGAHDAATYSNVRLLTWIGYQSMFLERWLSTYFAQRLLETDPLIEYTEPINSRIFKKADSLSQAHQEEFHRLRRRHLPLAGICLGYQAPKLLAGRSSHASCQLKAPSLPLRETIGSHTTDAPLPEAILAARSYRLLLTSLLEAAAAAITDFDDVFGERA